MGGFAVVAFVVVLVVLLAALRLAALRRLWLRVRRPGEARRGLEGGRSAGALLAGFAFAGGHRYRVLGGEAAAGAGVVDVDEFVGVLADELGVGEEVGVVARLGGIGEEGGALLRAGGDQVDAAFVGGGVGGAACFAAAGARGLPLVDVEADRAGAEPFAGPWAARQSVAVGADQRFGGLEEGSVAFIGEEAG